MYRIGKEEIDEITKVIAAKRLFRVGDPKRGHQQEVARFEQEWAGKIGTKYALCMNGGGTAALTCGLFGLGIGVGDEVLVPAYTFMATASAVLAVGAIPVLTEIDATMTIDPADIERKISRRTKAIIPVHMVGLPADMPQIMKIAKRHGLKVLEDCCQADGGSCKGKRLGNWGQAGAYSFNDFKIMSCGEGGALVTNDKKVFERAFVFHDSGTAFRPYAKELSVPIVLGPQFRASEIMGAILRVQLKRLEGMLKILRASRQRFMTELADVIKFAPSNDPQGDCGVVVAFQFDNEAQARRFAKAEGVGGMLPIDSGKHVYYNWEPIIKKRVGAHPALNPFCLPQNKGLRMDYSKNACPQTIDILSRTVFISLHPDWTKQMVRDRIAACRKALI